MKTIYYKTFNRFAVVLMHIIVSPPVKFGVLFTFNLFGILPALAQIFINEACPRNGNIIRDEDGGFEDWIELYNIGTSPVNLLNYTITDDSLAPAKWTFPDITIKDKGFLTLFASGKDRKEIVNHWETAVFANDQWKYIKPTSPVDTLWATPGFDDSGWNTGTGGIGYGDGDDITLITSPCYSVFMRRQFFISDTSKILSAIFNIDYDDAFVAYLNGVEIARQNVGENGKPTPFDVLAFKEHEAIMYQGMYPENMKIEEWLLKAILFNGMNVLTVQVHNVQPNSSDLTSLPYLSFGITDNSTFFSAPPSWFDGGRSFLHTNFKLNGDGESVFLFNASQQPVTSITFPAMQIDNSYGCFTDGVTPWKYFGEPTPDATNNTAIPYSGYNSDPFFSIAAGFYSSGQTLYITSPTPGADIRYTADGSMPLDNSSLYTSALTIDSTIVIRARCFSSSALPSSTVTHTYFIKENSTLPVISLSANPSSLFDWFEGIYMMGPYADTFPPFFGANFWQEWQIPGHIEYFDKQKVEGFDQDVGLEIFGNYSRSNPQKSFKVVASGRYGPTSIDYRLFQDKEIFSFKQFALRNAGNDWNQLHFRDAFIHKLCMNTTGNDVQAYQPCLVFINGEYWGVYNIREKINKDYIAENHGVNPDSIDLIQYNGMVMSGNVDDLAQFADFIFLNDFTDTANYAIAKSWLDVDNFIDYFAIETWSENGDWLPNNVRYWRERKAGAKWRHILWDLDFYGTMWWWSFTANSLDTNMKKISGWSTSFQSILFDKLIVNTEFRHNFINRYADLLNTILVPQNLAKQVYSFRDTLEPEMVRQFKRWGDGYNNPAFGNAGQGTYDSWKNFNVPGLLFFNNNRQITARNHIQQVFSLKQQVPVTLDVYPPGAGVIKINTVQIDTFPWGGVYFDSVPVTITAIPKPGYQFAFWQSNKLIPSPDFNISVKFNPDTSDVFTAYFFGSPDTDRITISEINYNPDSALNAGDWAEIKNYGNTNVNISGWVFKDGNDANSFVIPQNTTLYSGEYLVLSGDTALFETKYPDIANILGSLGFGLNSSGENIRLFDASGNLISSVNYSSAAPWPADANGTGKTLELLDPYGNLNSASNWFSGCIGGSPGEPFSPCPVGIEEKITGFGFTLKNYPNPFSNSTTISFILTEPGQVRLNIIDVTGKKIMTILNQSMEAGEHIIPYRFSQNSSGVYFYQIITVKGNETKQMEKLH